MAQGESQRYLPGSVFRVSMDLLALFLLQRHEKSVIPPADCTLAGDLRQMSAMQTHDLESNINCFCLISGSIAAIISG